MGSITLTCPPGSQEGVWFLMCSGQFVSLFFYLQQADSQNLSKVCHIARLLFAFLKVVIFFSVFLTGTQLPVFNLHLGNANMQIGLHPFHTTKSHCVSADLVTSSQGLPHTAVTKSWGCRSCHCSDQAEYSRLL